MNFVEERSKSTILHVSPFNSEKKCAGVAVLVVIPSSFCTISLASVFGCCAVLRFTMELVNCRNNFHSQCAFPVTDPK
jgi:hypothetical protein